jgi:putative Holliday junction resolvase
VGVDLGLRRIGLAISDPSGTLARPLRTIERGASDTAAATALAEAIAALAADDDGVEAIVVGLPKRLDGSDTEQTLHSRLALIERDWRKRKARLDAAAAAVILQDYLDSRTLAPSPAAIED